jgi:hypothetical protein
VQLKLQFVGLPGHPTANMSEYLLATFSGSNRSLFASERR